MSKQHKERLTFSFQYFFYILASAFGILFFIYLGKNILVPFAAAVLISFILLPICRWLERKGVGRVWSIIWTMLSVFFVTFGALAIFSAQTINILKELGNFRDKLSQLLVQTVNYLNQNIGFIPRVEKDDLVQKGMEWAGDTFGVIVSDTLSASSLIVSWLVLCTIYTFLLLLYRSGLKNALLSFVKKEGRNMYSNMLNEIQKVGQQYLTGMGIMILILGVLNSTGLLLLGIDYPFFFGFLAALLALIPYVGTTLGGFIPTLYAFLNYNALWYPFGVIMIFWFVQFLEGNFLNPKIVGENLNINALAAIFSLIIGGFIWGIPGMILFLPLAAIFKVVCKYYEPLHGVGKLIENNIYTAKSSQSIMDKIKKILTIR